MTRFGIWAWLLVLAGCGGSPEREGTVPDPVPVTVAAEEPAAADPEPDREPAEPSAAVTERSMGEGPVEMDWWASVRAPDGSERRWDLDSESFAAEVAGFECGVGAASASQSLRMSFDGRTHRTARGTRVLICRRGSERRSAQARCGWVDDGQGPVPDVEPAVLELGEEGAPHVVTVGCEVVPATVRIL